MNFLKLIAIGITAVSAICTTQRAESQNLQSVSDYNKTHARLLAYQSKVQDQIKLTETEIFANQWIEEEEPEMDIYTEGWDSKLVNPYNPANVPDTKVIDVSKFHIPCPGRVTSPYGYRPRFRRMHKGIDLKLQTGDTVYAAFSGRVRLTNYERRGYGYYIILRHENELETVYGHLSKFLVEDGQDVKVGQPIALGGNTGRSFGAHLHFETRYMGYAINPAAIFDFENKTTHTDTYTFDKRTFKKSRDYSPSSRYKSSKGKYSGKSTYRIRKGDSLGKIAARHGTTVNRLCRLNGLKKTSTLKVGKVIRIR
ncbi:MAG: peptidoglycan DD-metalloendopeptidase family protein [Muribaculaceae bacterium]|nr:peptidoglycan DD-metalloendopeptidase family protein [Muribaculaceae bacterium]